MQGFYVPTEKDHFHSYIFVWENMLKWQNIYFLNNSTQEFLIFEQQEEEA